MTTWFFAASADDLFENTNGMMDASDVFLDCLREPNGQIQAAIHFQEMGQPGKGSNDDMVLCRQRGYGVELVWIQDTGNLKDSLRDEWIRSGEQKFRQKVKVVFGLPRGLHSKVPLDKVNYRGLGCRRGPSWLVPMSL